jgi:ligand-binding sensor domain-containing protein
MNKYYFKFYSILLLLFYFTSCNGQILRNWNSISTKGPNSITRNVLQDKNGIYWFASWEGIINYDGKTFTNVTLKEALEQSRVFSIFEDSEGKLWFGTIGSGLYQYDGKSFIHFTTKDGLANNSVLCIIEDSAGNIWLGTEDGVSRYDGNNFTSYKAVDGLSGNVNSIIQDQNGKLWFGTRYGINGDVICYDGKSFTPFKNNEGVLFSNVRCIIEDKSQNIWIGGNNGLFKYNGKFLTRVSKNFIGNIFEDKAGNLWISEEDTNKWVLNKYDGKSVAKIATKNMVFGVCEDSTGYIWFGTMEGICRYDGKSVIDF